MLGVTLVQVRLRHRRRVLRVARRPWASGATCAAACSTRSPDFSAQEVGALRRAVADHPHHQRRAAGADARADDAARCSSPRRSRASAASSWPCARTSACRGSCRQRSRCWSSRVGIVVVAHGPAVPADAGAHRRRQPGAARADHRHPGRAGVRARARRGASASATPTTTSPTTVAARRPAAWRSCSRS